MKEKKMLLLFIILSELWWISLVLFYRQENFVYSAIILTPHDEYINLAGLEKWSEQHKLTKPAYNYMLCGYLLDRRFVDTLAVDQ